MRWLATVIVLCSLSAANASEPLAPARSGQLHYGWATASITPDRPVAIGGQYFTRITSRIHDPITATALAMETRDDAGVIDQVVFVACDLAAIRGVSVEKMRERLKSRVADLDADKVIVSATHTHTAPALTDARETDWHPYDFCGSWAYRIPADRKDVMMPAEYLEFLAERLADVVAQAWAARKPGSMSWALGHAVVAHNRRAVYHDGTARMYGNTAEEGFSHIEGASEHAVDALFFWRGEDQLEGVAVNVYCPAQETEGEEMLSADFWHETRRLLQRKHHADLQVLSLCGASGDQSPHLMWNQRVESAMRERRGVDSRTEIARRIVAAVDEAYEIASKDRRAEIPLVHLTKKVPLPVWRVSDEQHAEARDRYEAGKDKTDALESDAYINWRVSRTLMSRYAHQEEHPHYEPELHFVRLGEVAVATNPFELYSDYSLRIKAQSPASQTLVLQLAADCGGYLPTRRAVAGGGYSARIVDGVVGPEGGDVLVRQSVEALRELWPRK